MSTADNLAALKSAVEAYYAAALKLYEELRLSDTPADSNTWRRLGDDIDRARKMARNAEEQLIEAGAQIRLQSHINWAFRSRRYVVRRSASAAGTELTWRELRELSTDGPWQSNRFGSLDTCRSHRESQNLRENTEPTVNKRGWQKGAYVWEIWAYDSTDDSWKMET